MSLEYQQSGLPEFYNAWHRLLRVSGLDKDTTKYDADGLNAISDCIEKLKGRDLKQESE